MTSRPSISTAAPAVVVALLACVALLQAAARPAAAAPPRISAPSAILVEPVTGDVVFQRRAESPRPIASTTKLMTALLTLERLSLDDVLVAVPYRANPVESLCGLRGGDRVTTRDLLRCLLLASGNDAAATLAVRVAGSQAAFVRRMNARARALGLTGTRYADPIGLSTGDRSTATDLVKLALVLRTNRFFRETVNRPRATVRLGTRRRTIVNRNTLVRTVPSVTGVKTGRTAAAGYVLVGSASRDGITVLSAVLGTASEAARNGDSLALLRYGLGRYRVVTPVRRDQRFATASLRYRDETVDLVASRTIRRTARRDERVTVRVLDAPGELEGPLAEGARVGTLEVRQRGRTVARVALVTAEPVAAATAGERLSEFAGRTATKVVLGALVACSLLLVVLRRRAVRRRDRAPAPGTEAA